MNLDALAYDIRARASGARFVFALAGPPALSGNPVMRRAAAPGREQTVVRFCSYSVEKLRSDRKCSPTIHSTR